MGGLTVRPIPLAQTRSLRQAILRPHESIEYLIAHETPGAFALGAFDEDDELLAVGFVGAAGEPGAWRVRGMATVPHARGRGAGSAILAGLLDHAVQRGAIRVWCKARVPARSLYERAGFRVVSEEFDVPPIGPHLVMEWLPEGDQATSATLA